MILLLFLTFAPILAISIFIYWKDKFEKEPKKLLVKAFALGMVSIIPAVIFSYLFELFGLENTSSNLAFAWVSCTIGIGFAEEFSKFLFSRLYLYKKPDFNEPFDGITYCVMVALGFATVENILYVIEGGVEVALARLLFTIPSHATDGVIIGYFLGLAKYKQKEYYSIIGLILVSIAHGTYDFFAINTENYPQIFAGFIITFIYTLRLSFKAIKSHQQNSPFRPNT